MNLKCTGLVVAAVMACAACGGSRDHAVVIAVAPMPPAAVDDHVVFADVARARAVMLDVSGDKAPASPTIVPLVPNPTHQEQRRGPGNTNELLVLSGGQPDDGTAPFAEPGLVAIDADGTSRSYRYPSAFDAISQSDDGKYAVLFFDQNAATETSSLLFNPNDIAIVDLTAKGTPVVHPRRLRSFGSSPQSVAFTTMTLNGTPHDLAIVLLDSYVAIIDLNHLGDDPPRPEYTIGLAKPGTDDIHLSKVIFSTTAKKIYLQASGSNDIYVVTLSDGGSGATGDGGANLNDFTPSVNQLGAGVGPSDMALYTVPGPNPVEKLLVTSPGSSQAIVIEPNTSNVTTVNLSGPADQILLFNQPSPSDPNSEPRALLYTTGADVVAFLDLKDVETRGALNVNLLSVSQPYGSALQLDSNTVMMIHQGTGLSLLDLTNRTVAEIQGPNLADADSDPVDEKLWLHVDDTVGFLDLSNDFQPNQVRVAATIQALVTVPSPSKKRPRVVVTHPGSIGWATVLDATDPTNLGDAYSMRGFLLSGVLQGGG